MKNPIKTKRAAIIALAAVGTIGAASIAYAVFGTTVSSNAAPGGAENVQVIQVTGAQEGGALLPNESAHVLLSLTNPNNNVKAQITGIAPDPVVVDPLSLTDGNDAADCATYVGLTASNVNNSALPTLSAGATGVNYRLHNAVQFADAPFKCEGMTWTTTWKVSFQAVR